MIQKALVPFSPIEGACACPVILIAEWPLSAVHLRLWLAVVEEGVVRLLNPVSI